MQAVDCTSSGASLHLGGLHSRPARGPAKPAPGHDHDSEPGNQKAMRQWTSDVTPGPSLLTTVPKPPLSSSLPPWYFKGSVLHESEVRGSPRVLWGMLLLLGSACLLAGGSAAYRRVCSRTRNSFVGQFVSKFGNCGATEGMRLGSHLSLVLSLETSAEPFPGRQAHPCRKAGLLCSDLVFRRQEQLLRAARRNVVHPASGLHLLLELPTWDLVLQGGWQQERAAALCHCSHGRCFGVLAHTWTT